jgi:hypothetical protein
MICLRCSGRGTISNSHFVGGDGWESQWIDCPDCNPTGNPQATTRESPIHPNGTRPEQRMKTHRDIEQQIQNLQGFLDQTNRQLDQFNHALETDNGFDQTDPLASIQSLQTIQLPFSTQPIPIIQAKAVLEGMIAALNWVLTQP